MIESGIFSSSPTVECTDHVLACAVGYPPQIIAVASPSPPLTLFLLPPSPFTFRLSPCASNRVEMGISLPLYMHTHIHIPVVQWPMRDRVWCVVYGCFLQIIHSVLHSV